MSKKPTCNLAEVWEELIVSMLAVNNRSLEKTYALHPLLRKSGVVDPRNLAKWGVEDVVGRLKAAGLDWGPFMTGLFAERLISLGEALKANGVEVCAEVIQARDPAAIKRLLLPVNGIGPKVLDNFFILRGLEI